MELPINVIIILSVALLVLIVIVAFFGSNILSGTSSIEKNQLLTEMCSALQCQKERIFSIEIRNEKMHEVCASLGFITANACLNRCGCNAEGSDFPLNVKPEFTDVPIDVK